MVALFMDRDALGWFCLRSFLAEIKSLTDSTFHCKVLTIVDYCCFNEHSGHNHHHIPSPETVIQNFIKYCIVHNASTICVNLFMLFGAHTKNLCVSL
jgi:hypothetical protein